MGIEENEEMDEFDTVTLEMEDGSEVEFAILDEFEMETEKYSAVVDFYAELD